MTHYLLCLQKQNGGVFFVVITKFAMKEFILDRKYKNLFVFY
jgi:hypothetical protein